MSGAGVLDFAGRTVIVTGAARGIGLGLARAFAQAGATLLMADRDPGVAEAAGPLNADARVVDVSRTDEVDGLVAHAIDTTGRIDVIVNNAGILRDGVLWKLSDEDWSAVLDVHLGGTFRMIRACTPHFRAAGYGRIVNVTSYTGLHGNVGQSAYAAAKAGIIGLTKTAAKELARFGVTANAISPNARTTMVESIPAARLAELEAAIPLGRFGEPGEMAPAVLFLASEQAAYVTGAVLPVDGGLSM